MNKSNDKTKKGTMVLDNQSIQITIYMPSGRFEVLDKVSQMQWSMKLSQGCGELVIENGNNNKTYRLGESGTSGVLFNDNDYYMRSTDGDDFHDVQLTGTLGDDPDTSITIRYLLSTTFPVLNCYCFLEGAKLEKAAQLHFPLGLQIPKENNGHIFLPLDVKKIKEVDEQAHQLPLWEPQQNENHQVLGSPFFMLTQRHESASAGCIGFLQHPLSSIDIVSTSTNRCATPGSSNLDKTGKTETIPFFFRYQFFPSEDLEAMYWLCREYFDLADNKPN